MIFLLYFFVFIFGTLIGSFLNVVILRYNTGKHILGMKERSQCFSCSKELQWYELVPVISFLVLRGKCSVCKSSISWQYPLVEISTGLLFLGIFLKNSSVVSFVTILQCVVWAILVVITVYDMRHKIIPDGLVYVFIFISLALAYFFPASTGGSFVGALAAGFSFFAFFAALWFVSGGRWLGFGDAKLVLGVGFLLGAVQGLSALTLAFWIGAAVSIILIVLQKISQKRSSDAKVVQSAGLRGRLLNLTMKSEVPFAPFIILGTLIAFFCHVDIFGLAYFL